MPRRRDIDPGFFRHRALYDAEADTGLPLRVAFAGLWCVADREGRFRWRPWDLKLDVLPYDPVDFDAVLTALASLGLIRRYVVDGEAFGDIPNFAKYQHPHPREAHSKLPACQAGDVAELDRHALGEPRHALGEPRTAKGRKVQPEIRRYGDTEIRRDGDTGLNGQASASVDSSPLPAPLSPDYLTACVQALNAGLGENRNLPSYRQVSAGEQAGTVSWEAEGIPLAVATATIRKVAGKYRPTPRNRQPSSLRYFDAAVREAHTGERKPGAGAVSPPYHAKYRDPYAPPRGEAALGDMLGRVMGQIGPSAGAA